MSTLAGDEPTSITDDGPTTTPTTSAKLILLFKAGLALGIPPEATLPPRSGQPTVYPEPHQLLRPGDVRAALGCRATEVGRGRIAAGELDRRLHGLVLSVSVCRVVDGSGALISMGVVWSDPVTTTPGSATSVDHWAIVKQAAERPDATREHLLGFGDDGFLWLHGGRTAVIAWLDRETVATVSVTSPPANWAWATAAVRAVAVVAAERLEVDRTRT
jgi:hypothetical protein